MGVLAWRQHSKTTLHHMLPHNSPSGTLDMGVGTQSTMSVVVPTTLTVVSGSAAKQGPPSLHDTLTHVTPLRGIPVMGLTK
jgi:hypothetical protein